MKMQLRSERKHEAAKLLDEALNTSPPRGGRIRKAWSEKQPICYTPEEALLPMHHGRLTTLIPEIEDELVQHTYIAVRGETVRNYHNRQKLVDEHDVTALTVCNVDESGFSMVQKRNQKIIARRGKHQVGGLSSDERGVNATIVCCANAAGQCKRMTNELKIGAPPGAIVTNSDSGYINSERSLKSRHMVFSENDFIATDVSLEGNEDKPTLPEAPEPINHDHAPEEVIENQSNVSVEKILPLPEHSASRKRRKLFQPLVILNERIRKAQSEESLLEAFLNEAEQGYLKFTEHNCLEALISVVARDIEIGVLNPSDWY
ncbi:hypothetical protein ILUMI_02280 [Ignelater luminosus]|uniref:Uncharacterized protein n=1 Tax=Ignelater luminosus TaxID=2038154 RepID=A0A8K0GGL6_IGNLU|nr:hypothetical protein ILUMI_02280 [Ignelater luminosus]